MPREIGAIKIDGVKLCEARLKAEMSVEQLGAKLRCQGSTVSRWERGLTVPRKKHSIALVDLFGLELIVPKGKRGGTNAR